MTAPRATITSFAFATSARPSSHQRVACKWLRAGGTALSAGSSATARSKRSERQRSLDFDGRRLGVCVCVGHRAVLAGEAAGVYVGDGMSKEAMKLALEALENSLDLVSHEAREAEKMYANVPTRLARVQGFVALEVAHEKAITTLREALAEQPAQQEPVAWRYLTQYENQSVWTYCANEPANRETRQPLYTSTKPSKTCPPCHGDCNQGRACPARGSHA